MKRHSNIESLERSYRKAAADFSVDVLRNLIDERPLKLKGCMRVNGGRIE